ncbi:hypothetical protein [Ruminococcus flavefaciens]|uniref:hypothetical protein n=1 Tax=Ruminococcus flavefaciens TaxID=1265 RepID=UPI0026E9F1A8|nr:hypothetical protein [Ruminococcus flavefaciens]
MNSEKYYDYFGPKTEVIIGLYTGKYVIYTNANNNTYLSIKESAKEAVDFVIEKKEEADNEILTISPSDDDYKEYHCEITVEIIIDSKECRLKYRVTISINDNKFVIIANRSDCLLILSSLSSTSPKNYFDGYLAEGAKSALESIEGEEI